MVRRLSDVGMVSKQYAVNLGFSGVLLRSTGFDGFTSYNSIRNLSEC